MKFPLSLVLGAIVSGFLFSGEACFAEKFYVDPVRGSSGGDGTQAAPWKTLEQVLGDGLVESSEWDSLPWYDSRGEKTKNAGAPIKPGDTIILMSGFHGAININSYRNPKVITVRAGEGEIPTVSLVHIESSTRWRFQNLSISPSHGPSVDKGSLFQAKGHGWRGPSSYIELIDSQIFSVVDARAWSKREWVEQARTGVTIDAPYSTISGNVITNVSSGVETLTDYATVENNQIRNFSGDGIRGLGDYSRYENNYVANGFSVNENHDDGFQSWVTKNGEVTDVILRGNIMIFDDEHPNPELRSDFQGIGAFDGFFTDWVVENNVIVVNNWHGITFCGAKRLRVINNTVVDIYEGAPGPAAIRVCKHKNGSSGSANVVLNNLASSINITDNATEASHNLVVKSPHLHFRSVEKLDFSLKDTSDAVDVGIRYEDMHPVDAAGAPRVAGAAIDLGAFEFSSVKSLSAPTAPILKIDKSLLAAP